MLNLHKINNLSLMVHLVSSALAAHPDVVPTKGGDVRGKLQDVLGKHVQVFLGIPYASPPVGNLRFLRPQPPSSWGGVYNATSVKDSCMQPRVPWVFYIPTALSEDCLYLNVWTPNASLALDLPVFVWFHGGIFKLGSSYETRYNGAALAALNDVVVVSGNFRSGMYGFFDANDKHSPGNMALWDQVFIMRWVQRNIENFGGNPELVTLFGESSGAMDIHLHLMSPFSVGLFRRVFLMSGTESIQGGMNSVYESIGTGNKVSTVLGCADAFQDLTIHTERVLKCLRNSPADDIVNATDEATAPKLLAFFPTFKTEFVPYLPSDSMKKGLFQPVDAMISVITNEGAFAYLMQPDEKLLQDDLSGYEQDVFTSEVQNVLNGWLKDNIFHLAMEELDNCTLCDRAALRQASADFMGKHYYYCPTRFFSEAYSAHGGTLYGLFFGHRSKKSTLPNWMYNTHMEDIPYYFGIPFLEAENYTDEDREVSAYVMKALATFGLDGKPTPPDGQQWPAFTSNRPNFLWLQPQNYTLVKDFYGGTACDLWRNFL